MVSQHRTRFCAKISLHPKKGAASFQPAMREEDFLATGSVCQAASEIQRKREEQYESSVDQCFKQDGSEQVKQRGRLKSCDRSFECENL